MQHQLVSTHANKAGETVYSIGTGLVLQRLLHPYSISSLVQSDTPTRDPATPTTREADIVEYLVQHGQSTMSKVRHIPNTLVSSHCQ